MSRPDRGLNSWELERQAERTRAPRKPAKVVPPPTWWQRQRARISPYGLAVGGITLMVVLLLTKLLPKILAAVGTP